MNNNIMSYYNSAILWRIVVENINCLDFSNLYKYITVKGKMFKQKNVKSVTLGVFLVLYNNMHNILYLI